MSGCCLLSYGALQAELGLALPRRPIVAAATVITHEERTGTTELLQASTSDLAAEFAAAASAVAAAKKGASKWVIDEAENLKSTDEQRAWTWTAIALMAAQFQQATSQIHDSGDVFTFGSMLLVSYVLADLGTGVCLLGQGHDPRVWGAACIDWIVSGSTGIIVPSIATACIMHEDGL